MGMLEWVGGFGARIFQKLNKTTLANSITHQRQLLTEIIKRNASTDFGRRHHFSEIRSIKRFQGNCTPQPYDYFLPYIEAYISGRKDSLFNDTLLYFAQTTGTTNKSKLIPVPYHTIKHYNLGVFKTASCFISEDPDMHSRIIGGKWLYLTAPPVLRMVGGVPAGYITGQLMLPIRNQYWRYPVYKKYYAPLATLRIKNIEMQFRKIAEECKSKKITLVVGTTSVVVNLLEFIKKASNVNYLDDVLPDLELAILSGSPPRFYASRLNNIFSSPLPYREMYAATEGMMAVQLSSRAELTPLSDSVFFEFVPVNNPSERLLIDQVKKGTEYSVVITSFNGLYAYDIGDMVKFTSEDPPGFVFTRRKDTLDITGEKVTASQIHEAIMQANLENACSLVDYYLVGTHEPKPRYIFLVEFDGNQGMPSSRGYLASLDRALDKLSVGYDYNRFCRITLGAPELWVLKRDAFSILEKGRIFKAQSAGQVKSARFSHDIGLLDQVETHVLEKIYLDR
jgi:hypothetical protein